MTDKRTTVLDAAIELLGTEGLRALTHRRVDSIAGVPAGSTSNYFRTRQALVEGVLDRLLERDRVDVAALAGTASAAPRDERELEDLLCGYVLFATDSDTVRTRARFAMFVEAMAVPELRAAVEIRRSELRAWGAAMLADLGADGPGESDAGARLLVDYLDGVILHRLTSGSDPDPREGVRRILEAVLRPEHAR
ncbi:TetR/AcrR family transcriptional regulator [Rhodococcus artemisiae]|uniref:TetR family transcriptional regulator n=1 Tax=Rhodococcus artemisiae TaxID=714159 RepID=A0ABU7L8X3_9NOCA|nr:TetR family transcriptional regulator C-terminal domain-containing protein [Rhodococcus artemisiae]MEE2057999.1 TetR family transcriptional regulator [Rhodococcus artemisiae]